MTRVFMRSSLSSAGDFEDFGFEAFLGFPKEKVDAMPGDMHTQMEARLGMGAPPTRPMGF